MDQVINIWTDGAAIPNPGFGGWAAILEFNGFKKMFSGRMVEKQSNNRMEVIAAIEALKQIKPTYCGQVKIYSDSQYLVNVASGEWQLKSNFDLFEELWQLTDCDRLQVSYHWIRGHSGILENEQCNSKAELEANRAMREVI